MQTRHAFWRLLLFCSASACSATNAPEGQPSSESNERALSAPEFVEATSYFTDETELEAWYAARSALKQAFDAICGDTFCEGDISNIESLSFRCSVDRRRGTIGECLWVFGGSQEELDPATGAFTVSARHWECRLPLARRTPVRRLLATFSDPAQAPLYVALPGTARSVYDGLADCL